MADPAFLTLVKQHVLNPDEADAATSYSGLITAIANMQANDLLQAIANPGTAENTALQRAAAWSKVNADIASQIDVNNPIEVNQLKVGQLIEQSYTRQATSALTNLGTYQSVAEMGQRIGVNRGQTPISSGFD